MRGLQKNHAQLQKRVAPRQSDFSKSCFKFDQVGKSPRKFQNHPRGKAFRKIMLDFKNELHPGTQIFQKVSNLLKIEYIIIQSTCHSKIVITTFWSKILWFMIVNFKIPLSDGFFCLKSTFWEGSSITPSQSQYIKYSDSQILAVRSVV